MGIIPDMDIICLRSCEVDSLCRYAHDGLVPTGIHCIRNLAIYFTRAELDRHFHRHDMGGCCSSPRHHFAHADDWDDDSNLFPSDNTWRQDPHNESCKLRCLGLFCRLLVGLRRIYLCAEETPSADRFPHHERAARNLIVEYDLSEQRGSRMHDRTHDPSSRRRRGYDSGEDYEADDDDDDKEPQIWAPRRLVELDLTVADDWYGLRFRRLVDDEAMKMVERGYRKTHKGLTFSFLEPWWGPKLPDWVPKWSTGVAFGRLGPEGVPRGMASLEI